MMISEPGQQAHIQKRATEAGERRYALDMIMRWLVDANQGSHVAHLSWRGFDNKEGVLLVGLWLRDLSMPI